MHAIETSVVVVAATVVATTVVATTVVVTTVVVATVVVATVVGTVVGVVVVVTVEVVVVVVAAVEGVGQQFHDFPVHFGFRPISKSQRGTRDSGVAPSDGDEPGAFPMCHFRLALVVAPTFRETFSKAVIGSGCCVARRSRA